MSSSKLRTKDSGVECIGQIPEHWETRKLNTVGVFFKGRGIAKSDVTNSGVPAITYGDIYTRYGVEAKVLEKFIPPEVALNAQEIRAGDLLFTGSGETIEDIGKTTLYSGDVPGYAGGDIIVLRTRQGDALFLSYALNSDVGTRQKSAFGRGDIIVHISAANLKQVVLPLPPEDEARQIARYLDHKTALIDDLIAGRERQIELLQEYRTAIISRAVTKGLDPNVPMKGSGVEWLGKVPEHWRLAKLGYLARILSGSTPRKENEEYWGGDIPWVSPKDMKRRWIDSAEDSITEKAVAETGIKIVTPPVILIVVRGMILAHSFPVGITTVPVTINQDMKALVLDHEFLHRDFFAYWLEGNKDVLLRYLVDEAAHGTKAVRTDRWKTFPIYHPSVQEQRAIASFIDSETAKIDTFVAKVRESIGKLREYRQSLISAAVTGKIDVRGWESTSEPAEESLHA